MSSTARKTTLWEERKSLGRSDAEEWGYPTGMVWCPMKMSGMAVMKCARLQKDLGCGSLRQFSVLIRKDPEKATLSWPWLRLRRGCPERASEEEIRELRRTLSPLKSATKSRKNPRAHRCPECGGNKVFSARRCRRCWRLCQKKSQSTLLKMSFLRQRARLFPESS